MIHGYLFTDLWIVLFIGWSTSLSFLNLFDAKEYFRSVSLPPPLYLCHLIISRALSGLKSETAFSLCVGCNYDSDQCDENAFSL